MDIRSQTVSPGVLLGPTFRVAHCACSTDLSLKDSTEWCEWCLCRKCGGKNLPRTFNRDGTGGSSEEGAIDVNWDLGLLVLLICAIVYAIAFLTKRDSYLYTLALIAACYTGKDVAVKYAGKKK